MAVRFLCPACNQPIEVDDHWAQKAVACPYCLKTITAPDQSSLTDLARVPMATPLAGPPPPPGASALPPHYSVPPAGDATNLPRSADAPWGTPVPVAMGSNTVALVAFVLACAMMGCVILSTVIVAPHRLEIEELQRTAEQSTSIMEASNRFLEAYKGVPPVWFVAGGLLQLAAIASGLAALVCGMIGVRRPRRRGLAVAALLICGGYVIIMTLGTRLF